MSERTVPVGLDPASLALTVAGVVLTTVSFRRLTWYSVDGGADSAGAGFTFADLRSNADQLGAAVATAYFDRLAWGLLGLTVLLGLAARVAPAGRAALRLAGFLVGFAAAVLTYYALAQLFDAQQAAGATGHGVLHNASAGLWSALAGFVLVALGSVVELGARAPSDTIGT